MTFTLSSVRLTRTILAKTLLLPVLAIGSGVQMIRAQARVPDRIVRPIDNAQMLRLPGNVSPLARAEFDRGEAPAQMTLPRVTLFFKLTASQQSDLDQLLDQLQDRSSPNYHKWLSSDEFAARFGVTDADLNQVTAWMQSRGLSIVETARSKRWIVCSGSAQQISAAFQTSIHLYSINGEAHYANADEASVPAALADIAEGLHGLNDFRIEPRNVIRELPGPVPDFTSGTSGSHFISPADFATIYDLNPLYSAGINGTGQKIAVMGQTAIVPSDIATFRSLGGLPASAPSVVVVPNSDPGATPKSSDISEASLDLEWAGAVARNATIVYVNSTGVFTSLQYAVDQDLAQVISISYGSCEQQGAGPFLATIAQLANTKGITIIGPAGDNGAADCDATLPATHGLAVDLPAALPYVTGVGGTEFSDGAGTYWQAATGGNDLISSALSYIPEVVWNDPPVMGAPSATGGGASTIYAKPVWQAGPGVPTGAFRDVPDVAVDASPAHDGYLVCVQGSCANGYRPASGSFFVYGGTSIGVPTFAGMVALINQQTQSTGLGNINYTLYPLAANSTDAFHDITSGNNNVPCQANSTGCPTAGAMVLGYSATPGYDQTTGLGTPNMANVVNEWTSVSSTSSGNTTLSLTNSASTPDFQLSVAPKISVTHGTSITTSVTVIPFNGFASMPALSCTVGAALANVTCAVSQTANPDVFTLTINATAAAAIYRPNPSSYAPVRFWPATTAPMAIALLLLVVSGSFAGSALSAPFTLFPKTVFRRTSRERRARRRALAPAVGFFCVVLICGGCGGGSSPAPSNPSSPSGNPTGGSGTTPASGNIAVVGTGAGLTHTAQIAVTLN